jgi:glycosyltransferase involved in cell wall biosynthesis
MKILIVSEQWPWPLDSGGKVAQFGWIDYLRHHYKITLIVPIFGNGPVLVPEELRTLWPDVRLIAASPAHAFDWKATLKAAIKRVLFYDLIRSLLLSGPADSLPTTVPNLPRWLIQAVATESALGYDLIQVEYYNLLSLIHGLPENVPKVFCHLELQFVVRERTRCLISGGDHYERYMYANARATELDNLARYDAILTMTEHDRLTLERDLPNNMIWASPFAFVRTPARRSQPVSTHPFSGCLVYLGGSDHQPNVDAVSWFLKEMWPTLIARQPSLRLKVVGRWSPEARKPFKDLPGVVFTGFVEDLDDLLPGTIMIVPLRIGSGMRTKILLGMALGIPIVTTRIGAEGIAAVHRRDVLYADEPSGFVTMIFQLIDDPALQEAMSISGRTLIADNYSPEAMGRLRASIYETIVHAHRRDN